METISFSPNRERFFNISHCKTFGDAAIYDRFHRYWSEVPNEWVKQGAPKEILNPNGFRHYFGLDHMRDLEEIIVGVNRIDLQDSTVEGYMDFLTTPPIVPAYKVQILREDETHRVEIVHGGQTIEVSKAHLSRMPKFLDHPVKDRSSWEEYRKRLDPDTLERWLIDWPSFVQARNDEDAPTMLVVIGLFGMLREWSGLERTLLWFYDEPKLIEDMMDQIVHLVIGVLKRVAKDIKIDLIRFWEDMAYKSGPLISPEMFKKFMVPRYRMITDFLRSEKIDILQVDCDGNIDELIPLWLDVGINYFWPLEVAAGMDAVSLRKEYGKQVILGGNIDKRVFSKDKRAIHDEIMAKVPYLLQTGAYFPSLDHAIPPEVSFDGFRYYLDLLREISGKDRISR